jgi:hypothetical protein
MRIVLTGQEGLYWRQLLLQNDEGEVKKRIDERFASDLPEGVQGDFDHFLGLDNYESSLLAILKVSGTLGSATGKRFFLPGLFCQARGKHPFVAQESRKISVDVHYPRIETDDVTIHLPAGYSVESAPQPSNIVWPEYALLKINSKLSPDSINVTRALAYNFTIVDPTKYTNLHDFYQKVATADHQQIVLTRSPAAAKSN